VTLDLERDRHPVSEIEHARVLAGALENALAVARQALEEAGGVLVPAVLGPEKREDRELEVVRLATEERADALRFPVGQPEGAVERLRRNAGQAVQLIGGG
jgi:hypothetical protein